MTLKRLPIFAAVLLIVIMIAGCTSAPSASNNSSSGSSSGSSQSNETIEYHGVTFKVPDGFDVRKENDEPSFSSNSLGHLTVQYHENVGDNFLDPGVFEERSGLVEGGTDFDSIAVIERSVNQGCKTLKWTKGEGEPFTSRGYVVLLDSNALEFQFLTGTKTSDEFDRLVSSIEIVQKPTNAVDSKDWDQTTTIKSAKYLQQEQEKAEQAAKKEQEEAEKAAKKEREEARKKATHQAGSYRVGTDIPAGEYKLEASGHGYYCVYPDTAKGDILENDNFTSVNYITVEEGQYIELKRCSMVEAEYAEPTTKPEGDGMYKIGFDIPAGEYKLDSTGHGYYCILDNSTVNRDILQNDNFEGTTFCVVSDGQYLQLSRTNIAQA